MRLYTTTQQLPSGVFVRNASPVETNIFFLLLHYNYLIYGYSKKTLNLHNNHQKPTSKTKENEENLFSFVDARRGGGNVPGDDVVIDILA